MSVMTSIACTGPVPALNVDWLVEVNVKHMIVGYIIMLNVIELVMFSLETQLWSSVQVGGIAARPTAASVKFTPNKNINV
jgi:hypothetical protein